MKNGLRIAIISLLLLTSCSFHDRNIADKNLAYEMSFVWKLADALSEDHSVRREEPGKKEEDPFALTFRELLPAIYYHFLIECNGPLPELANLLRHERYTPAGDWHPVSVDIQLIVRRPQIHSVLTRWIQSRQSQIEGMLANGGYTIYPACIEPIYLSRNPTLEAR